MSIPGRSCLCWTPVFLGWQACLCCPSGLSLTGVSFDKLVFDSLYACSPWHWFCQSRAASSHSDCGWTAMSYFDMSMVLGRFLILSRQFCAMFLVSQMLIQHLVPGGVHLSFCLINIKGCGQPHPVLCRSSRLRTLVFTLTGCSCSTSRQLSLTQLISCLLLG